MFFYLDGQFLLRVLYSVPFLYDFLPACYPFSSGNPANQLCEGGGEVRAREWEKATTDSALHLCVDVRASVCLVTKDS